MIHHVVLTSTGGATTTTVRPVTIPGLTPGNIADLDRYLDATRSSLLYARKVLLVEGPAEQFLIPPLVKEIMEIDLDEEGIAVIPIYGTHFQVYAKLFGPEGIRKKCAVLADGDLVPSDATPDVLADEHVMPVPHELDLPQNNFISLFQCDTTFERELTLEGTLEMFEKAATESGAPQIAESLREALEHINAGGDVDLENLKTKVLNTAKRFGKARFAQIASKYVSVATELPPYIRDAITWLIEDAPD
jgi:putative ATP-dependent endonuclease of OLD family